MKSVASISLAYQSGTKKNEGTKTKRASSGEKLETLLFV